MSKRAVVLAGGKGSRLRPYSAVLPKPLMPVGDDPILAVILQQLALYGFDRVTLAVNYQAEIIKALLWRWFKMGTEDRLFAGNRAAQHHRAVEINPRFA